jgi:hypothetical protein
MSSAISRYKYQPLWPGSESIRLLRLLPSKDENAAIQCELFHCSLHESGKRTHPYDALSYVWGKAGETRPIRIGKLELPVTLNLYGALKHLRHFYIERIIWVDAICINQVNVREKERQIRFMAKIYSEANRVVVWLGEMEDNSDQALEELCVARSERSINSLDEETTKKAIFKLLQRPWFRRIWVREQVHDENCINH